MYPNFYYIFKDFFGVSIPFLKLINTFGFFVAISFITSSILLSMELKRREKLQLLQYSEETIIIGNKATIYELITNFLIGFLIGFKIIALLFNNEALKNPQAFILSSQGNFLIGLLVGLLFLGIVYYQKKKKSISVPEKRIIRVWPSDRVSDIVFLAIIWGIIGAKIFNSLETFDDFLRDPIASLISFGGLTFYGGLIFATIFISRYAKKKNIDLKQLADSITLILLLSYSIGRLGCYFSGDGDWGIVNNKVNPYSFLPNWLWSDNFPRNVINAGIPMANCFEDHCRVLAEPVYPTALYESIISFFLFLVLWLNRRKIKKPLIITGLYCIANGIERFLIEKIRVNYKYEFLPFSPTQAEIISTIFILTGLGILIYVYKKKSLK